MGGVISVLRIFSKRSVSFGFHSLFPFRRQTKAQLRDIHSTRALGRSLHVLHRLDRLTSVLLMLGKTKHAASRLECAIRERRVEKRYVCLVDGHFPTGFVTCSQPIA